MTDITPAQWRALMDAIALDGVRVRAALKRFGISPAAFRRLLKAESQLNAHFVRAKRSAKRRRFPMLVVDAMLEELARTNASLKEVALRRGYSLTAYKRLVDLIWRTPEWKEDYLLARGAKVARMGARLMGVPDEELVARGKRWISREAFKVHALRPMPERRAATKQYRAGRAAQDPIYAARLRVKHGTKRTSAQQKEI